MESMRWQWIMTLTLCLMLAACEEQAAAPEPDDSATEDPAVACWCHWQESQYNPILEAPAGEWLLGDPSVVVPDDSPDTDWHMFANTLTGVHHYASDDGIAWRQVQGAITAGMRPYLYHEDVTYYLLYERYVTPFYSQIEVRSSPDLYNWSQASVLLQPSLPWESDSQDVNGNPYLLKRDGIYWLYYSASSVFLTDSKYWEPLYLGVATATTLTGPYTKRPEPIVGPDTPPESERQWRDLGAGSMKLLPQRWDGRWLAITNGIYSDADGASHSSIRIVQSQDGLQWQPLCPEPVISPGDQAWKYVYVYGFDLDRAPDNTWRMYFNARDGWAVGTERIGFATRIESTDPDQRAYCNAFEP